MITGRSEFCRWRFLTVGAALFLMASCSEESTSGLGGFRNPDEENAAKQATRSVEQEVEAPEVFSLQARGLWDGVPSFGSIWVAHPDVKSRETVIIRNLDNGESVKGQLYRRERELPGPAFQISSEGAAALGIEAGVPVTLDVVALRMKQIVIAPEVSVEPDEVSETPLDPIAVAEAAIDAVELDATPEVVEEVVPVSPPLEKPFIQVGIFNIETYARAAAKELNAVGVVPTVKKQDGKEKPFWRVLVGPAADEAERKALLESVRSAGFDDAYAVTH